MKKTEIAVAAVTLMFVCYMLGYFVGQRTTVAPVTVEKPAVTASVAPTPQITEPTPQIAAASEPISSGEQEPEAYDIATPAASLPPAPSLEELGITPVDTDTAAKSSSGNSGGSKASASSASAATPTPEPEPEPTPVVYSHYDAEGRLRINLATSEELQTLPGIGEALAERIIAYRDTRGGIAKLTSLQNIEGIGEKRYLAIRDMISAD